MDERIRRLIERLRQHGADPEIVRELKRAIEDHPEARKVLEQIREQIHKWLYL